MMKRINPYKKFLAAHVPNWLLERTEISAGAKLCYARLMQHAGKDNECWPGEKSLAEEMGTNLRQIQRYVAELKRHGLIETEDRGIGHSQAYYFWEHEWMSAYADRSGGTMTTDPAAIRESVKTSSEVDPNGSSSSSAGEEEEEDSYMGRLPAFYKEVHSSPLFLSAVKAPGPYFKKLRATGDVPPGADLTACRRVAESLADALNSGLEAQGRPARPLTVPGPTLLPGLACCLPSLERYKLQPRWIRLALGMFCEADGEGPEIAAADILERIAKRPDLFDEALRVQSEKLG